MGVTMEQNKYAEMFSTELKDAFRTKLLSENYSQELVDSYLSKITFPQYNGAVDAFVDDLNKRIPSTNEMLKKSDGSQSGERSQSINLVSFANNNLKAIAVNLRRDFIGRQMTELESVAENKGITKEKIQETLKDIRETNLEFASIESNPPIFSNFIAEADKLTRLINEAKEELSGNVDSETLSSSVAVRRPSPDDQWDLDGVYPPDDPLYIGEPREDVPDESQDDSDDELEQNPPMSFRDATIVLDAFTAETDPGSPFRLNLVQINSAGFELLNDSTHQLSKADAEILMTNINQLTEKLKTELGTANYSPVQKEQFTRVLNALDSIGRVIVSQHPNLAQPVVAPPAAPPLPPLAAAAGLERANLARRENDNPSIESKNTDGNMTHKSFPNWIKEVGSLAGLKFAGNKDNLFQFAEDSDKIKYNITVTADPKNPNNFLIQGTDVERIANLARAIHKQDPSIPLTLKMGNDPEKAFELLKTLNKSESGLDQDRVKINVTPDQIATFEKAFKGENEKLKTLGEIIETQDRLKSEVEPARAPRT